MKRQNPDMLAHNKIFTWIAFATGLVLFIPLVAMQFTDEVNWTLSDFIIMGVLIFGSGSTAVLTARKTNTSRYRIIIGFAFLMAFLYLWAELAVGIFTTWGS